MKKIAELISLQDKTAIVTGGSMGIGYAIVKRLAEAGANVVIADVSDVGEAKATEIKKMFKVKAIFVKTDVSDEASVNSLFAQTEKAFGGVDILVNNAGIYPFKPILEMDLALWEKVQAVNLRGVFLTSRAAGQSFVKRKAVGNIINIASVDALHPSNVGLAAYDASKHGVWGFTKNFALEMAPHHVRVNAVAPGGIRTEGVEKMTAGATLAADSAKAPKEAPLDVPMKRMGEPDEMALATLYLASDMATYCTGTLLVADGGMLLK